MDDKNIRLKFRYSEREYVQALRASARTRLRLPLDIAMIAVCAIVGFLSLRSDDSQWFGIFSIAAAAALSVMILISLFVIPTIVFRSDPKFKDEYELDFSSDGIHFKTAHIDSEIQWSFYQKALIIPSAYVLYNGKRNVSVIPKRVFESPEKLALFDSLVVEKVPQIARKK
jgi:predicted RND superfamily exporter protein